jgi:hypothetical protein
MIFIKGDEFSKESPLMLLFMILSTIGIYDITREIIQDHKEIFKQNIVKKVLVFSGLYLRTNSIFNSSVISIIIFLLFPKVFFGETTTINE